MAGLKPCKRIKVPPLLVRYLGTPVKFLKLIRFSLLHSIRNLREVLSGVIVSTSETMWERIRPTGPCWSHSRHNVYNTAEHSATGFIPFELLFGRPSTLPSALKKPPELQYNYDDYSSELKGRLQMVHQRAHKNLVQSKVKARSIKTKPQDRRNCRQATRFCFLMKHATR